MHRRGLPAWAAAICDPSEDDDKCSLPAGPPSFSLLGVPQLSACRLLPCCHCLNPPSSSLPSLSHSLSLFLSPSFLSVCLSPSSRQAFISLLRENRKKGIFPLPSVLRPRSQALPCLFCISRLIQDISRGKKTRVPGISFRIICLFFSFQSGSGGIFAGWGKNNRGRVFRGLSLFDLRSCGPRGWQRFSGLGEIKWAVEKMRPLSFAHIISLICLLCGALLVTPYHVPGCSLSRLSFASLDDLFFFFPLWHGGQVGRGEQWLGTLNARRNSLPRWRFWTLSLDFCTYLTILLFPYIGVDFRLQLPFQMVTLLVLFTPWRSHYEGHSLSPWGPCECLKVLILHIQQSIQQAFLF